MLSWHLYFLTSSLLLLGGIAAADSAYSYTFLRSVVGLSSVRLSHVCPLRKPFYGFDAIWHIHLWGPMRHCVRWRCLTVPGEGEI